MNDQEKQQIIDFINQKYEQEVPRAIKFVVRRQAKKMAKLKLAGLPESFRNCTIEELILILKDSLEKKTLKL